VFTGFASQNATEEVVEQVMGVSTTFTHFFCYGPTPGAGTEDVLTVRVNGVSVSNACKITSGSINDYSEGKERVSITIGPGELFDVMVQQGSTAGGVSWALAP